MTTRQKKVHARGAVYVFPRRVPCFMLDSLLDLLYRYVYDARRFYGAVIRSIIDAQLNPAIVLRACATEKKKNDHGESKKAGMSSTDL